MAIHPLQRRRSAAPSPGAMPALPHERDESVGAVAVAPDRVIARAKLDIDAGLVDTDMRATPGLDAARREQLVPGPGGQPLVVSDRRKRRR